MLLFFAAAFTPACSDMLDVVNENEVDVTQHYNTAGDADNAILAIYGKMMGLVDRLIVLGELRADLMDITPNATFDMAAISSHTATAANEYCNVAPFYEVILNCNDALTNFDKMLEEKKMSNADYRHRYADVATVRCWIYLQLAIHFGSIPYVTEPLTTVAELKRAQFSPKSFDEILQLLIACMEGLPSKGLSTASPLYDVTIDGYFTRMLFLNKYFVLGDLYLWADRYVDAAAQYYAVIDEAERLFFSGNEKVAYKLDGWVWAGSNEPKFQVCYVRYKDQDQNSFRNKWKEIFSRTSTDSELRQEMITMWSYNPSFAPRYPLVEIFANTGLGEYRLKPSEYAIDLWENRQTQTNGFVYDGRGKEASFDYVNGQPVVIKYLYDYYSRTIDANRTIHLDYNSLENEFAVQGKWFVQRAALLHLRYAEAANRAGYPDLAYALLNDGIFTSYNWSMEDGSKRADNNISGVQYTGYKPASDNSLSLPYPSPFYLDARMSNSATPYFRSPWRDNYGIRRRASLTNVEKPDWVINQADSIRWLEESLLVEAALECGFEGHRWGDMLRIAMRKNRDNGSGTLYINDLMGKAKSIPALTPETWFLTTKE
ncbi:MAG: RagB/SusD family nutrient uptake outer membrane protein [Prevotellaceae bacterium]|nr:RagB/SusD family nutrient uptake outer membrane protein [Prevotellaceae bacterium]